MPNNFQKQTSLVAVAAVFLVQLSAGQIHADGVDSLRPGMSMDEARALAGPPSGTMGRRNRTIWHYGSNAVVFTNGFVESVSVLSSAPRRLAGPGPVEKSAPKTAVSEPARPADKHDTLVHEILRLERRFGSRPDDDKILDRIIEEARTRILPKRRDVHCQNYARDVLRTIHRLLVDMGFRYQHQEFLGVGLRTKRIDCDLYSFIYLAIAETLDLPVSAIIVPGHAFVRWEFPGGSAINWETTVNEAREAELIDGYYYCWFRISSEAVNKGVFLKGLNRAGVISLHHFTAGLVYHERGDFEKSLAEHSRAIEINPRMWWSYQARAGLYERKNMLVRAIADSNRAIALNPTVNLYLNRASMHVRTGRLALAIEDLGRAIEKEPSAELYLARADLHGKANMPGAVIEDYRAAIREYDKAIGLDGKNAELFFKRGLAKAVVKDLRGADIDLGLAIFLDPSAKAYRNRGEVKRLMGFEDAARKDFMEAIRLQSRAR